MGRSPCCDKLGLKKGPWTPEEDRKLIHYIREHGHGSWRALPKQAGLLRCGKSCRLRWTNYLRPDIKRGKFSFDEEQIILQLHALLGNRWSNIANHLPGRTDNEIKNYWNTHLKKRLLQMGIDPVTHRPRMNFYDSLRAQSFISSTLNHMAQWESARLEAEARLAGEHLKMMNVDRSSAKLKASWTSSDDVLTRLLGSSRVSDQKNPDSTGCLAQNLFQPETKDLSSFIQKWDQSNCSASNFELPSLNTVISSISNWPDPREMFELPELDHNSTSSTTTVDCSFADAQTLPFLENDSPGIEVRAGECAALHGQATIPNFGVTPEVVIDDSSLVIACSSDQKSVAALHEGTGFLQQENGLREENSQFWATTNRFLSDVQQDFVDDQCLTPEDSGVTSNTPSHFSEGKNNVYQPAPVMSVLKIWSGNNAPSSPDSAIQIDPTAVLRGEDGKDYWSNMLKLVGPAS